MNVLTIGGKVMPRVQKLSVSHEAVWSKNAGRGATGAMIGDIICLLYTSKGAMIYVSKWCKIGLQR